jgi:hypothetical protein
MALRMPCKLYLVGRFVSKNRCAELCPSYTQLALWWSFFEFASASVRSGDILSGYIYLSTGSNSVIGFVQGINGVVQVCW